MTLPGDRAPRIPAFEILHAVSIDAPPHAVWQCLVQLGQDRAGFYSYDGLERMVGADVHNVFELRPEWQTRRVGDRVCATPEGYLGGLFGTRPGWNVEAADKDRALVLQNWGAFVIQPDGSGRTRLLIRSTTSNRRIPVWAAAGYCLLRRSAVRDNAVMRRSSPRPRHLGVKAKFWLTLGPRTLFGDGKADLLEAVDRLGSLRRAAHSMDMSYRHAWGLLRELDTAAGFAFLEHSGTGPRTRLRLTADGRRFIEAYRQFREPLTRVVEARFRECFRK